MGAAGRALVALAIVMATACGSVHTLAKGGSSPLDDQAAPSASGAPIPVSKTGVPWLPLPPAGITVQAPPASPLPAIPVGTASCKASQMEGAGLRGGAAAGNIDLPLLLRNKSTTDCFVVGYADVTVLDRFGHVLASAVGSSGVGTFFGDGPVIKVLMPAGTPPLPKPFSTRDGSVGQAFMNFSWYDCQTPPAATIEVGLPMDGGTFSMPYATRSAINPYCQTSADTYRKIERGPLSPAGVDWPPPLAYLDVRARVDAPASAVRGSHIHYLVTLFNASQKVYDMRPCPDYFAALEVKHPLGAYRLNCAPVVQLAPGASVTFEMEADIPEKMPPGPNKLSWLLTDPRLDYASGWAPIDIT
jgi:hypothetical protein